MATILRRESSRGLASLGMTPTMARAVNRPFTEAETLPAPFFTEPEVYRLERSRIFRSAWTCVGREDEVSEPGSYLAVDVGTSSVLVVRDEEGRLRAFQNVCRHRGTRLVEEVCGTGPGLVQCPYHAWTYTADGRLVGAPHMDGVTDFRKEDYGLLPVRLESWRGFLFLNFDVHAAPLLSAIEGLASRAKPYPLEGLRRTHRVTYDIRANWKLVSENVNECYHCPGVHPALAKITPYRSGGDDRLEGPTIGGWMDLVDAATTLTVSGTTTRSCFANLSEEDRRRVYYYYLFPQNFFSFTPDYVTLDRFVPLAPDRTLVIFDLYVDGESADDADDAMRFWDITNRQDWHICELAQLGASTDGYVRGRYSEEEEAVHAVDRTYLRALGLIDRPRVGLGLRGRSRRTRRSGP